MTVETDLPDRVEFHNVVAHLTAEQIEGVYMMKYVQFLKAKRRRTSSLILGLAAELFAECASLTPERKHELQRIVTPLAESHFF